MPLPVQRTFTSAGAALTVPEFMTDDQTTQTNFLTLTPNVLQDVVNMPDPTATDLYSFTLFKNGNATSVRAFSAAISPATAGRVPIGPVSMSSGSYQWQSLQTGGVATATTRPLERQARLQLYHVQTVGQEHTNNGDSIAKTMCTSARRSQEACASRKSGHTDDGGTRRTTRRT